MDESKTIKEAVRQKYAQAARQVRAEESSGCCGTFSKPSACCGTSSKASDSDAITSNLYAASQLVGLPAEALEASLGCGNPTALAELKPGEIVLDLGSGGGIDVLLSARRVAPSGKAYGLDMTDEMLALARENQRKARIENAEFLRGEIENIPLPDLSVDVVISNCVVNLSADKDQVFSEVFRILKPGGRLAISDVVFRGRLPDEIRRNLDLWAGCVAGALEESEYRSKLAAAGFEMVEIEPVRIYDAESVREILASHGVDTEAMAPHAESIAMSAMIRARKPALVNR